MGRKQGIDKSRVSFINATEAISLRPLSPLVGAVGTHPISLIIPIMLWADIPIKGEQPSGHKTLKATIRQVAPRFTSSRGSRQIKATGGGEPTAVLSGRLIRIASDLSRGMQECTIITQRCGPTVSGARALDAISPGIFHSIGIDFINSRWKIRSFKVETEINSRKGTSCKK